MKKIIKTGVLSYGMSGKLFQCPFLNEHTGFELYAIVERSKKEAHLSYPNIISFDSVDDIFNDPEIELVIVNTPTITHYEFALKAIHANKHVLVEKAFTVTSSQAKKLFKEAKKYKRFVLPYQNRRYDSDYLSAKKVIESGKLGRLVEVHFRYDRYRYGIGPKISKETAIPGSGLLYDLGPHLLDIVISLFGKPLTWSKNLGHFRPKTKVDDYAHIHLIYPNQLQVFITMSMLVTEAQPAFIIHGTKGSFIMDRTDIQEKQLLEGMLPGNPIFGIEATDKYGTLTTVSSEGIKNRHKITSDKSSYTHVFEDVYQTIREGKPYPVSEDEILQQLEILES